MRCFLIILVLLAFPFGSHSQSISQLGSWSNNANFTIKYHQDKVITSTTSGIQFIDVSDPTSPSPTASIGNPGSFPMAIEVAGNYAYFGGGMTGYFMVADISNVNFPMQVGITYDISGTAYQIAVAGSYAFMATNTNMFYCISISDPTNPTVVSSIDLGTFPTGVVTNGNYVFVGTNGGLKVIDVINPSSPSVVSTFGSGYYKIAPDFSNQRLFVAKASGFDAIDISNPSNPVGLFMGVGAGSGGDIGYWNNYVFQNELGNVSAHQVSASSSNYLGSFNATFTGQVNGIAVKDSVFYVSTVNTLHVLKLGSEAPTFINDQLNDAHFEVYPNPFIDHFNLELERKSEAAQVRIYDIAGRAVYNGSFFGHRTSIDFSKEAPGNYFITLQQGDQIFSKKLVKMK